MRFWRMRIYGRNMTCMERRGLRRISTEEGNMRAGTFTMRNLVGNLSHYAFNFKHCHWISKLLNSVHLKNREHFIFVRDDLIPIIFKDLIFHNIVWSIVYIFFSLISGIYDDDQEIITLSRSDFGMLISWWTLRSMYDRRV